MAACSEADLLSSENTSAPEMEVFLRVWDCGGQPVFLNVLPAFLTARTLFLLMFNAIHDLQSPCLHLSHCHGSSTEQLDEMSTLELILQWIATIHATLIRKQSFLDLEGASSDEMKGFPRILPVGEDSNFNKKKELILKALADMCANKAFTELVLNGVIVDNTTAGSEESEDPAFQIVRQIASRLATRELAIDTPITWVLFRKVFDCYSQDKPVVPLEEVKELAVACSIPEDAVPNVLAFYHDLSVFFHYTSVPSLASKVIASPQWLIRQMAKILALEGFEEYRNDNLWKLLREDGILVELLYREVLKNEELEAQAIIDLLEHFLVIARIHTSKTSTIVQAKSTLFLACYLPFPMEFQTPPVPWLPHSTLSLAPSINLQDSFLVLLLSCPKILVFSCISKMLCKSFFMDLLDTKLIL